jgi:hypothetical protein
MAKSMDNQMSDERIQEALAAHLEHAELGGVEPDLSHLSSDEREKLAELIGLLDATDRVGLGLEGGGEATLASTDEGKRLITALRDALPFGARIAADPAAHSVEITTLDIVEGFIVGTFGGRVRVWLLADDGALEHADGWLRGLERVFRLFPDTVAITLVEPDHSCLLVQPEDCAPTIEVPRGSLVGRRYRRPVSAVGEALSVFLSELIPHWEPMLDIGDHATRAIDIEPIASERAGAAIAEQIASGNRARKTNPKRKALMELGDDEAAALTRLLVDVHAGEATTDNVEEELRRLASRP